MNIYSVGLLEYGVVTASAISLFTFLKDPSIVIKKYNNYNVQ
jgi:hypothetical protein